MKYIGIMSGILLGFISFGSQSIASTSNYPISWITYPKMYTDDLSDASDCQSGGLIANLICKFKTFGMNGVGTFSGKIALGNHVTVVVTTTEDSELYNTKLEAWVDFTTRDGTNNRKFMSYLSSASGKTGHVEMLPDLLSATPVWSEVSEGLTLDWDAREPTAETMTLSIERAFDSNDLSYHDRNWGLKMLLETNSVANVAKMSLGISQRYWGTDSGYELHVIRSKNLTLVQGDTMGEVGIYDCVRNSDIERLSSHADYRQLIDEGTHCYALRDHVQIDSVIADAAHLDIFSQLIAAGWFE